MNDGDFGIEGIRYFDKFRAVNSWAKKMADTTWVLKMREMKVQCPCCRNFHSYRVVSGPGIQRAVQNSAFGRQRSRVGSGFFRTLPLLEGLWKPPELSSLQSKKYKIITTYPSTGRVIVVSLSENVKLEYIPKIEEKETSHE